MQDHVESIYIPIHKLKIWLKWFWLYLFNDLQIASTCQHFICKVTKESISPLEMRYCSLSSPWLLQGQDLNQRMNTDESLFNSLLLFSDHLLYYSKYDLNNPEVILINLILSAKSLPWSIIHFRVVFYYYCSTGPLFSLQRLFYFL